MSLKLNQDQQDSNTSQQRSNIAQQGSNISQQKSNKNIEDKVDQILTVLTGNLDGTEGLVSLVKGIHTCIHDKDIGLAPRVTRLEKTEDKRSGWTHGVSFVVGIFGVIIGWLAAIFSGVFNHKP